MKKILLFMVVFSVAAMLHAQPMTSSGFTSGSKTEAGVSVVLGVPFTSVFSGLARFRRPSGLRGSVGMDGREGRRTPSGVRGRFRV